MIQSLDHYYKNLEQAVKESYEVFDSTPTTFVLGCDDKLDSFYDRFSSIL